MKVTFWARFDFAKAEVIAALQAVPGAELTVAASLPELLGALPETEFVVLTDAPTEQARQVMAAIAAPPATVRHMHFNSAGRHGFEAAGIAPGVTVTNAEDALSPTVAEHAFALLLGLTRRLPEALDRQHKAQWGELPEPRALDGATLLIIGFGHIGREVARRARAFGMRIVVVNRTVRPEPLADEVLPLEALHQALPGADAVIACIAQSPQTAGILGREALALCRPETIIVNVGRGGLIDSNALVEALQAGQIAGAGLDVTDPEPLPPDHALWGAPNLIVTPHVAGASARGAQRIASAAAAQLAAAIARQ